MISRIQIIKHDVVPKCGSYGVRFPDVRALPSGPQQDRTTVARRHPLNRKNLNTAEE
jgi:hypothetical protein